MASQENTSCYSCEGTLLVPTVDDRVSHWRERLVSGNRLTITLKLVGQRWSSDACFLLWGENYQQEKVFEVNLRFVRGYFLRTRTWHEITSSDRRRFALNFHDSNQFARFLEELESTLSFLNKLTKTDTMTSSDDASEGIVVLRTDKLPPAKPPRAGEHRPLSVGSSQTPPWDDDDQRVFNSNPELKSRVVRVGSTETKEDVVVPDAVPGEEQTTKWYVNIYDRDIAGPPPVPKRLDDLANNIYETIADLDSSPPNLNESNTFEGIDTYDNIIDELRGHLRATKPNGAIASDSFLDVGNGKPTVVESRYRKQIRKPIEAHVYDDRDRYDNVAVDIATNSQPVPTKPKPLLPARCNELPTGNKTAFRVTNDANRQPNVTSKTATPARPQPLPRPRKPKDDRSQQGDDWTCNQCTLLNPATASRCAACDSVRHESRGVQHVTVPRDDALLQRLPSSYVVPSACFSILTANDTWTCSVCSASNRRGAGDCHSCSAWVCAHCTLHNDPELWICSVCSRSRLQP